MLNDLLESENVQVRSYVNGTLYSVLTRPALKDRAMSIGTPAWPYIVALLQLKSQT